MTAVELFCGMGGATEGLKRAGFRFLGAVDAWDAAVTAHKRWHPEVPVVQAMCEAVPFGLVRPDLVWASPSCKPWSVANRTWKRGKKHSEYFSLANLVRIAFVHLGSKWLIIENVGGLVWSREGITEISDLRRYVALKGLCLSMPKRSVIPSNTLGVAQLRRRVFIVVGPKLVSIRPGSVLLPLAGAPPMLWETDSNKRAGPGVVANEWGLVSGAWRLRASRKVVYARERSYRQNGAKGDAGRGRDLATCGALQMVPMEPLAGFSKRVAHELVGNAVPPPVAEHIARIVMEANAPPSPRTSRK